MIKAVLFDYGGVLTEGGKSGCMPRLFASIYGIDPAEAEKDRDLIAATQLGTMTGQEFLEAMNKRHPASRPATSELYLAASDLFVQCGPVYELAARLRSHGIATGILSNINDLPVAALREQGFYEGFDPVLLSYEVKMSKPDRRFYELAVEQLGVKPEEILMVDDLDRYLEPAKAMGMRVILAKSPEQIVQDTEELILKENGTSL